MVLPDQTYYLLAAIVNARITIKKPTRLTYKQKKILLNISILTIEI